jgi:hypothetical protein
MHGMNNIKEQAYRHTTGQKIFEPNRKIREIAIISL